MIPQCGRCGVKLRINWLLTEVCFIKRPFLHMTRKVIDFWIFHCYHFTIFHIFLHPISLWSLTSPHVLNVLIHFDGAADKMSQLQLLIPPSNTQWSTLLALQHPSKKTEITPEMWGRKISFWYSVSKSKKTRWIIGNNCFFCASVWICRNWKFSVLFFFYL